MIEDLTVIFLTVNRVPLKWAEYQKGVLCEAIGDTPIITISAKPLDWGINLIQDGEPSIPNVYKQVFRGAQLAQTKYIAIAEDDVLYPPEHFREFRPPDDAFGYNYNRWGLLTWGGAFFYYRERMSNATLVARRDLVVEALEERYRVYPGGGNWGELGKERGAKLTHTKSSFYYTSVPVVYLSHVYAMDPLEIRQRKAPSLIRAHEIPRWGRAEDVRSKFI